MSQIRDNRRKDLQSNLPAPLLDAIQADSSRSYTTPRGNYESESTPASSVEGQSENSESSFSLTTSSSDEENSEPLPSQTKEQSRTKRELRKHRKVPSITTKTIATVLTFQIRGYYILPLALVYAICALAFLATLFLVDDEARGEPYYVWAAVAIIFVTQLLIFETILAVFYAIVKRIKFCYVIYFYTHLLKWPLVLVVWGLINRFVWDAILNSDYSLRWLHIVAHFFLLYGGIFTAALFLSQIIAKKFKKIDIAKLMSQYLFEQHVLEVLLNFRAVKNRASQDRIPIDELYEGRVFQSVRTATTTEHGLAHAALEGQLRAAHGNHRKFRPKLFTSVYEFNKAQSSIRANTRKLHNAKKKNRDFIKTKKGFHFVLGEWMRYHKIHAKEHRGKGAMFHESKSVPIEFAREVARIIFSNLDNDHKKFVDEQDFAEFYPKDQKGANRAFQLFARHRGNNFITTTDCTETVQEILQRRQDVHTTLNDRENVNQTLIRTAIIVATFLSFFFTPFLFGVSLGSLVTTLSLFTLGLSFLFGNIIKSAMEGIVLLFVERQYDVGDLITIQGYPDLMRVTQMNILTTELHTTDGRGLIIPNSVMYAKGVVQYARSKEFAVNVAFQISAADATVRVWKLRDFMVDWMENESIEVYQHESMDFWVRQVDDVSKMEVRVFVKLVNISWSTPALYRRELGEFHIALLRGCSELGITYVKPLTPVSLAS